MSERLLEVKSLTIKFGGVTALSEVNLHVCAGEIAALIGPNGAGKNYRIQRNYWILPSNIGRSVIK